MMGKEESEVENNRFRKKNLLDHCLKEKPRCTRKFGGIEGSDGRRYHLLPCGLLAATDAAVCAFCGDLLPRKDDG